MQPRTDGRVYFHGRWRTLEQVERKKEHERTRVRSDDYKRKKREKSKEYYNKNKEELNKKARHRYAKTTEKYIEKRKEWTINNRDKQNETQRNYYKTKREQQLVKILRNRKKRDPTIGLKSDLDAVKRGELGIDQVIKRFGDAVARVCKATSGTTKD